MHVIMHVGGGESMHVDGVYHFWIRSDPLALTVPWNIPFVASQHPNIAAPGTPIKGSRPY